jgi:hypothetical protein
MRARFLISPLAVALVSLSVLILRLLGFKALHSFVRSWPTVGACGQQATQDLVSRVAAAIDWASPLFVLRTFCLARSAATTCLLRLYGIQANVVIGCGGFRLRHMPGWK